MVFIVPPRDKPATYTYTKPPMDINIYPLMLETSLEKNSYQTTPSSPNPSHTMPRSDTIACNLVINWICIKNFSGCIQNLIVYYFMPSFFWNLSTFFTQSLICKLLLMLFIDGKTQCQLDIEITYARNKL